jgi:hypothetical protein
MNTKVKVAARNGQVVVPSENNPEFASIRVEQTRVMFVDNWIKKKNVSALIQGSTEELRSLGFVNGMELPGNIYVKESVVPFRNDNAERDLKYAGDTGVICMKDNQPIYRITVYNTVEDQDVYVQHTNTEQIRNAQSPLPKARIEEESFDL